MSHMHTTPNTSPDARSASDDGSPPIPGDDAIRDRIESSLESSVKGLESAPELDRAVRYALLSGGKRVRPMIAAHACLALGGTLDAAMPGACAIECVHAFSLVHDDLPALDNDDVRRGRPTVHRAFGESLAILAGDALQTLSIEVAVRAGDSGGRTAAVVAEATREMIVGQVLDTDGGFPAEVVEPIDRLRLIHRLKTGALIKASCRVGALAAGAPMDRLDRFGDSIGLMFQVVDDVLDETRTVEELGKTPGKDREAGKLTFPSLIGLEASQREIERLEHEAMDDLAALDDRATPLRELVHRLARRTN